MGRLALLVAIMALILSWAAYRRAGGELKDVWSDATRGAADVRVGREGDGSSSLDLRAALERAREKLLGHRDEVAGNRNLDQVQRDVGEVRTDLERSLGNASAATRERWKKVDGDLNRVQDELKAKSDRALAELDATLEKMRRELGEDKGERKDGHR